MSSLVISKPDCTAGGTGLSAPRFGGLGSVIIPTVKGIIHIPSIKGYLAHLVLTRALPLEISQSHPHVPGLWLRLHGCARTASTEGQWPARIVSGPISGPFPPDVAHRLLLSAPTAAIG